MDCAWGSVEVPVGEVSNFLILAVSGTQRKQIAYMIETETFLNVI